MRVAITGASGFIGSATIRALSAMGHQVSALVRATSRRDHIEGLTDRFVTGDQADEAIWPHLLDGADCLIHNSADWDALRGSDTRKHLERNLVSSIRLIEAAGSRQVIFVSSVAVHHDIAPKVEGVIDEDHPLRPGGLYGAYKASVEDHLWAFHADRGLEFAIHRPAAVYGIDPRLDRSIGYPIIERLRRQQRFSRLGGGKFVHVDDVAQAIARTVGRADLPGRIYNLADCYARWSDWARVAAEIMGIDAEIDASSPQQSKNTFDKRPVRALGIDLDRGHEGIKEHLRELAPLVA